MTHPREVSIRELEASGAILEIQDGNHGERHPKATDYVGNGIPFVMANDLKEGYVEIDKCQKITEQQASQLRIGFAKTGDVLLTHKGTVGNVAIVGPVSPYIMLTPQVTYYRLNPEKLSNSYLSLAFRHPTFQKRMRSLAQQSTRPYIGIRAQRNLQVWWVDRNRQDAVVEVISSYDNLIETNRRRIALLERAAQELYREWFVRLRFPGHEHTEITDSLPEGWKRKLISEVCETVGGGTPSTKIAEYWENGDITWVIPTDVTRNNCLFLLDSEKKITEAGLKSSSAKLLPANAILMTSRASVGFFAIADRSVTTNQGFINIIPQVVSSRMYVLHNLMHRVEEIRSHAGGTTYKEISKGTFRQLKILMPTEDLLSEFDETVEGFLHQVRILKKQTVLLSQARDLVLPRLIDGRISV